MHRLASESTYEICLAKLHMSSDQGKLASTFQILVTRSVLHSWTSHKQRRRLRRGVSLCAFYESYLDGRLQHQCNIIHRLQTSKYVFRNISGWLSKAKINLAHKTSSTFLLLYIATKSYMSSMKVKHMLQKYTSILPHPEKQARPNTVS